MEYGSSTAYECCLPSVYRLPGVPFYSSKEKPRVQVYVSELGSIGIWRADLLEASAPVWSRAVPS